MRRKSLALGTTALFLALTGPPAFAADDPVQQISDSTGAAQVGSVSAQAPVRVGSDGDESSGSSQSGQVGADPVRVTSGNGSTGAPDGATVDTSTATGQGGDVAVNAPVRVASDGNNSSGDGSGSGSAQSSTDNN